MKMHDLLRASESAARQIVLKSEYKNVTLSTDSILYIESIDNYIKVHLADGSSVLSKIPLHSVEEQLPQGEFIRIHRSFVVAKSRIKRFTRSEVTLTKTDKNLPVGKKYVEEVIAALKKKK